MGPAFDRQKLAFLEEWFGVELTPRDGLGNPLSANASELADAWNAALDAATVRLAAQGPLAEFFPDVAYDVGSDRLEATEADTLAQAIALALAELPANSGDALTDWNDHWAPMLRAYAEAMVRVDHNNLAKTDYVVMGLVTAFEDVAQPLSLQQLVSGWGLSQVQIGAAGPDALARAGSGAFVFVGQEGNDTLTGSGGQGIYVFGSGFGQDVIIDADASEMGDRIRFASHGLEDVTIARVGLDLVISVNGATDKVTVRDHFATGALATDYGVEEIQFADGTLLDVRQIAELVGRGTSASETLAGTAQEDQIEGLAGNDTLRGGDGGDTYFFSVGHGEDVIEDIQTTPLYQSADVLLIENGYTMDQVTLSRTGDSDDLLLTFAGSSDKILIKGQFWYNSLGVKGGTSPEGLVGDLLGNPFTNGSKLALDQRIETILFKAGGAFSWQDVQAKLIEQNTTSGADVAYGFGTADIFAASAGDDLLIGFDGSDVYAFNRDSGADTIHDSAKFLTLLGEDSVVFGSGISFSDLNFSRVAGTKDLLITIDGTSASLTIKDQFDGQNMDLFGIFGVQWFSRIEKFVFADESSIDWEDVLAIVTTGGAGDDELVGDFYADTLDGRGGADYLNGGDDGDTYMFGLGDGQDIIEDSPAYVIDSAPDKVLFKSGVDVEDVVFTRDGETKDLIITITGTTDQIRIKNQYDITETGPFGAIGFHQIERFEWADGTVKTWPALVQQIIDAAKTNGADTIVGSHYNDSIAGGAGADMLKGGNGSDTYVFELGDGADTIEDYASNALANNADILQFGAGVAATDIVLERSGDNSIVLKIAGTSDQVTIVDQFAYSTLNGRFWEIETIAFAGGVTWTAAELRANYLAQASTSGADTISGFWSNDALNGGAGNDILRGDDGSDVYTFGAGFGVDVIEENVDNLAYDDFDSVVFSYASTDAVFSRSGDDLTIGFTGTTDQVTIVGQFDHLAWYPSWTDIEQVTFSDAVTLNAEQIRTLLITQAATTGDDTIEGFFTADVLDGGAGNDILRGHGGGDTYLFGKGAGQDTIEDYYTSSYEAQPDTVLFAANVLRSEVSFTRVGDDLVASISGVSDTLTIKNHFLSNGLSRVELFKFADGTTITAAQAEANAIGSLSTSGADTITGGSGADLLDGGLGNDTLRGAGGNDTYVFGRGYGQDAIQENGGSSGSPTDRVAFREGVTLADLVLSRSGDDLIIQIVGTSDVLTIEDQLYSASSTGSYSRYRVDSFEFADGLTLSAVEMDALTLAAHQTAGADTLIAFDTDDTIDGGAGDDFMRGGDGDDTYAFGVGYGQDTIDETNETYGDLNDTIVFGVGVSASDLVLSRVGDDVVIGISGTGDQLVIQDQLLSTDSSSVYGKGRIEHFVFADGTIWSAADLDARLLEAVSTSGDDEIWGYDVADVIAGGAGNDTLHGEDGDDTYVFGVGDGQDLIIETGETYGDLDDTIVFGDGVDPEDIVFERVDDDLIVKIAGTSDQVRIVNQFRSTDSSSVYGTDRIERFVFANGVIWSASEVDAFTQAAHQTGGADTVLGLDVADVIDAGAGDDLMRGLRGNDTYIFGRGSGSDTIDDNVSTSNGGLGDTLVFAAGVAQSDLSFARSGDDLIVRIAETGDQVRIVNQFGSIDSSSSNGYNRIERFVFAGGREMSAADVDAITLLAHQTPGADTVKGYATDDTIDGGTGNDVMTGDGGNDTYYFGRGYGVDRINETTQTYGSLGDRVIFRDINPEDIVISRYGGSNEMRISVGADQLQIYGQSLSTNSSAAQGADRVEYFEFADGTVWTAAQLDAAFIAQQQSTGADTIEGFDSNDTIYGLAGADVLRGQGGDDTLYGGDDDDTLVGGSGADVLDGGAGTDTADYSDGTGVVVDRATPANSTGRAIGDTFVSIERFVLSSSADTFRGAADDEFILGGGGGDTLNGGGGNDTLYGGSGSDHLTGGAGSDIFDFNSSSETSVGANADKIYDFAQGDDFIDLSGIDAKSGVSGDQAFTFIGSGAFSNVAGQLRAVQSGANINVFGDTNGDGTADFQIVLLASSITLTSADFIL